MKDTYTREEVIDLLLKERQRAIEIAYERKRKFEETAKYKRQANNELAFVSEEIADECRIIGNIISGLNAISITLGRTMKDEIIKELK